AGPMTTAVDFAPSDPNRVGHGRTSPLSHVTGRGEGGPAPKRIVVGYGFWIYLLSDIIIFATLFATYAVLVGETAGGPTGRDLFHLDRVATETACLLLSSFAAGLAATAMGVRSQLWFHAAMAATFVLGAAFIAIEVQEFVGMLAQGAGPTRSAFLSAFFALVGT